MGIFEQFNLPSYVKGKSFADASKSIQDKFKGREDRDSIDTQRELLGRLKEAQEYVKAQEESEQNQSQQHQMPDGSIMPNTEMDNYSEENGMMGDIMKQANGGYSNTSNEFAYGGSQGSIMETYDPYNMNKNKDNNQSISAGKGMMSGFDSSAGNGGTGMMSGMIGGNGGGASGASGGMGGMSGGVMGAIGHGLGSAGKGLQASARMKEDKKNEGFVDPKQAEIDADAKMIDDTKDTVSEALGPFGQLFRGIQKAGQGVGDTIGGDSGAAVSGVFSPEEGTIAAFKDKEMSFGDKLLATIPGVGAVKANQAKQRRMSKMMRDSTYRQNAILTNDFANGGKISDPKKDKSIASDIEDNNDSRLKKLNSNTGIEFTKEGANAISRKINTVDSAYKNIYNIQTGVTGPDGESGMYYWYDDPSNVSSDNIMSKRDFVSDYAHKNSQRSLNPDEINPKVQSYLDKSGGKYNRKVNLKEYESLLKDNNTFAAGGYIDPWKKNQSTIKDDPNYTEYRGYEGTMSDKDVTFDLVAQYENSKDYNRFFNTEEAADSDAILFGKKGGHSRYSKTKNTIDKGKESISESTKKAKEWIGDNKGDIMRYAPVAMNAYQLSKLKKPKEESLARLNTRYDRQFADESTYQNLVREETNANRSAILNTTGGSAAAARANLLGSQLNSTKALSDAYSKIADINRGENRQAQDFNLRVDTTNLNQSNMENDINARNKGNYDTQKSKLLAELGNNIGDIGKEELFKKYPELMGSYYDSKGRLIKTKEQLEAEKKKKEEEDKKKNK